MNWRDFGVEYEVEGVGTLWLHNGTPFKSEIVRGEVEGWGIDVSLAVSWSFIILEGYVLDAEIEDDAHPIAIYLQNRGECKDLKARWELHQALLGTEDFMLLYDAFSDTRPAELHLDEDDPNEKKSATLTQPKTTPSKSETETAS